MLLTSNHNFSAEEVDKKKSNKMYIVAGVVTLAVISQIDFKAIGGSNDKGDKNDKGKKKKRGSKKFRRQQTIGGGGGIYENEDSCIEEENNDLFGSKGFKKKKLINLDEDSVSVTEDENENFNSNNNSPKKDSNKSEQEINFGEPQHTPINNSSLSKEPFSVILEDNKLDKRRESVDGSITNKGDQIKTYNLFSLKTRQGRLKMSKIYYSQIHYDALIEVQNGERKKDWLNNTKTEELEIIRDNYKILSKDAEEFLQGKSILMIRVKNENKENHRNILQEIKEKANEIVTIINIILEERNLKNIDKNPPAKKRKSRMERVKGFFGVNKKQETVDDIVNKKVTKSLFSISGEKTVQLNRGDWQYIDEEAFTDELSSGAERVNKSNDLKKLAIIKRNYVAVYNGVKGRLEGDEDAWMFKVKDKKCFEELKEKVAIRIRLIDKNIARVINEEVRKDFIDKKPTEKEIYTKTFFGFDSYDNEFKNNKMEDSKLSNNLCITTIIHIMLDEDIKKKIGRNTLEQLEILYKNYQMLLKVVKGRRNNKNKHLGQVFNVAKNPKATLRFMQNNLSDILKWMEATIEEIEKENTFIENLLQEKRKIKGGNKEYTNMWFYISRKAKPKILETKDFKSIHIIRLIKLVKTTTLSLSGKLVEELTIMDSNKKHAYNINYGALATVLENMLYKRYVKKDKKSKTVILNGIVINFNNTDSAKILRYLSRKVNIIYRYLK